MTRLTNGKQLIEVYMGNWTDGSGWGPDLTGELLGPAYERYDDEHDAILIDGSIDIFIDWARDWENGKDEWTAEALNDSAFDADPDAKQYILREIESRGVEIGTPVDIK